MSRHNSKTPKFLESYTGIGQIICQGNELAFSQYWYTISSIPVYNFANTDIRFCQCWYTISSIMVYNFRMPAMVNAGKFDSGMEG